MSDLQSDQPITAPVDLINDVKKAVTDTKDELTLTVRNEVASAVQSLQSKQQDIVCDLEATKQKVNEVIGDHRDTRDKLQSLQI